MPLGSPENADKNGSLFTASPCPMTISIFPIAEAHARAFHKCLDSVARERNYLGQSEAPPVEKIEAFVRENVQGDHPQLVAVDDERVVGWCDAIPHWADGLKHRAGLGMGVLNDYRGQGIGTELLRACLDKARTKGIKRIDLEVRADNDAAISLYEKFGFSREGRKPLGLCHRGVYYDTIEMGMVFPDVA